MKKWIGLLLTVMMMGSLSACGSSAEAASEEAEKIDVDLSSLSSTMVYSEVYNMVSSPEDYKGKMVRMTGTFGVYEGEERNYFSCMIADATSCCSNGIEFVLSGDYTYPEDYPELGETITVTGTFDTYMEGEYEYCQLIDAVMTTE